MSTKTKPTPTTKQRTAPQTGSPRRNHVAMYRYLQSQPQVMPRRKRKQHWEWHIVGALSCGLVAFTFSVLTASSLAASHRAEARRAEVDRTNLMTLANNSMASYRTLTSERTLQLYLADHKMVLAGRVIEPTEVASAKPTP